ncbi:MAG: O-antigen ligase family protein [candidate division FCPU426 bacterium]
MRLLVQKILESSRLLVLAAASLAVVVCLDPHSADPLGIKALTFSAGAGLLAGLSAARLWWGGRLRLPWDKTGLAFVALLAAVALSYFLTPAAARGRGETAFNAWCLWGLLVLAVYDQLAAYEDDKESGTAMLLTLVSLCLGLAVLWAFIQALGLDPSLSDSVARQNFGSRLSSRFGNPNFFGGFLVLTLPAPLWLAWRRNAAWSVLVFAAAFAGLSTGSKAVMLGLLFQFFLFGHLHWHSERPREERLRFLKRWAAAGAAMALSAVLALGPVLKARLGNLLDPSGESVRFRLLTWAGGLKAFVDRPVFGHGPGSFFAVYPAYRLPQAMADQAQHSYEVAHAENWVLQMAVEYGLLGLAALLCFLWLLGRPLLKAAGRSDEEGPLATCVLLALGGTLVVNLGGLDLFLPSSFWFVALWVALSLWWFGKGRVLGLNSEAYATVLVSLCILLFSAMPGLLMTARWKAGRELLAAETLSRQGNLEAAAELYQRCLLADPTNTEARYFLGATRLDQGRAPEALAAFEFLQTQAPDYVLVRDKKARALLLASRPAEAALEWERQIVLDPWYFPAVRDLAGLYASNGRLPDAIRVLEEARPRFPNDPDLGRNLELLKKNLSEASPHG